MARFAKTIALSSDTSRLQLFRWFFAIAAFAAAIALAGYSKASASHDGDWRVTIITQSGDCDPAYSYAVKVAGGQVSYSGNGSFDITGNVGEAGNVSVSISRGDQRANASGKLKGNAGAGQWSGKSASTACSGRWEAVRSL
ncbi:hypothetical protein [Bradyrhizobium prioriisuperbiae]|uniref:hypothetical protein n=1 Tax=Bradyrhizobium prioriisuperbiae TaxID=2854389 RepID=UPI0028E87C39|nr:hypothetical protein [Bradyrhizobium prioritasuperba]